MDIFCVPVLQSHHSNVKDERADLNGALDNIVIFASARFATNTIIDNIKGKYE